MIFLCSSYVFQRIQGEDWWKIIVRRVKRILRGKYIGERGNSSERRFHFRIWKHHLPYSSMNETILSIVVSWWNLLSLLPSQFSAKSDETGERNYPFFCLLFFFFLNLFNVISADWLGLLKSRAASPLVKIPRVPAPYRVDGHVI